MFSDIGSPRLAWASFFCGLWLAAGFALSMRFQGTEYAALLGLFACATVSVAFAVGLRSRTPRLSALDGWLIAFAIAVAAATLASRVLYLSLGVALWLAASFAAYYATRTLAGRSPHGASSVLAAIGLSGVVAGIVVVGFHLGAGGDIAGPFLYRHMFAMTVLVASLLAVAGSAGLPGAHTRIGTAVMVTGGFVAQLLIGLDGSRGVLLAAIAAVAAIAMVSPPRDRGRLIRYAIGAVAGFLVSAAATSGLFIDRVATLADPEAAGLGRFVLWASVAPLIAERPLLGHGPGLLFAVWPPVWDPANLSAGYYAHNSYIDIAVTMGVPAALLLLLALRSAIHAGIVRAADTTARWTMGAVVAIGVHGIFDFTLLVPTLALLTGVCLGALAAQSEPIRASVALPVVRIAAAASALALAALSVYAVTSGVGHSSHRRGIEALADGDAASAFSAAGTVIKWWPISDNGLLLRAQAIHAGVIADASASSNPYAAGAFAQAERDLAKAIEINPLRPETYRTAARLSSAGAHNGFAPNGKGRARALLERALQVDPKSLRTRVMLASLLAESGNTGRATEVLVDGLQYRRMWRDPDFSGYLEYAQRMAVDSGDRGAIAAIAAIRLGSAAYRR